MLIVTSAHIAMGLFMALVTQINLILHCVASSQTSLIYSFSGKPHLNPISLPFWLLLYSVFASQAFLKGSGCLLSPSAIAALRELTITMSTNTHSNSPPPRVMWLVCLGWSMGCCAVTTCGLLFTTAVHPCDCTLSGECYCFFWPKHTEFSPTLVPL